MIDTLIALLRLFSFCSMSFVSVNKLSGLFTYPPVLALATPIVGFAVFFATLKRALSILIVGVHIHAHTHTRARTHTHRHTPQVYTHSFMFTGILMCICVYAYVCLFVSV